MAMFSPFLCRSYHKGSSKIRQMFLLSFVFLLVACTISSKDPKDALGVVVSSDKVIASVGQDVLMSGGNAADAMSAMLMSSSVVLPSRTGLGSGGICQVLDPVAGYVKTLDFLPKPISFDGKISVPALARGVYTLQNKYGQKPWADVLKPAISQAKKGIKVSDLLARDIVLTSGLDASWKNLKKGDNLIQTQLAKTLETLAVSGIGGIYKGDIAKSLESQNNQIMIEELKNFKVSFMDSIDVSTAFGKVFFPNPSVIPSDGYMVFRNLRANKNEKIERGKEALKTMNEVVLPMDEQVQGASLMTADKNGLVVVCNVSMGQPFGTTFLTKEGFYLGQAIKEENLNTTFANILQTNPDITDVVLAVFGVGSQVLVNAVEKANAFEDKDDLLLQIPESQEDLIQSLFCEKGYPNHSNSCQKNENVYFTYTKND